MTQSLATRPGRLAGWPLWLGALATPAVAIFVSSNVVNLGNLAFNVMFSRWMGPALFGDLALLLTLKLALLGVFGAAQMAASKWVAALDPSVGERPEQSLARINRILFAVFWIGLAPLVALVLAGSVDARLGLAGPGPLIVLLLSTPFIAPLCLLRGLAMGRLAVGQVIVSANLEMAVRLLGAILAWQMGAGLTGVTAAVALSVVAGWAPLARRPHPQPVAVGRTARKLFVMALPFAVLQLVQVLTLDGDIFLAKAVFDEAEAGYLAALSLFQRIQFFGSFALASVLLPTVIAARAAPGEALVPVFALYLGATATLLGVALVAPAAAVELLVGAAYLAAAAGLLPVVLSAAAFTASYLLVVALAGRDDFRAVGAAGLAVALQLAAVAAAAIGFGSGWLGVLWVEAACQILLLVVITCLFRTHARRAAQLSPSLSDIKGEAP